MLTVETNQYYITEDTQNPTVLWTGKNLDASKLYLHPRFGWDRKYGSSAICNKVDREQIKGIPEDWDGTPLQVHRVYTGHEDYWEVYTPQQPKTTYNYNELFDGLWLCKRVGSDILLNFKTKRALYVSDNLEEVKKRLLADKENGWDFDKDEEEKCSNLTWKLIQDLRCEKPNKLLTTEAEKYFKAVYEANKHLFEPTEPTEPQQPQKTYTFQEAIDLLFSHEPGRIELTSTQYPKDDILVRVDDEIAWKGFEDDGLQLDIELYKTQFTIAANKALKYHDDGSIHYYCGLSDIIVVKAERGNLYFNELSKELIEAFGNQISVVNGKLSYKTYAELAVTKVLRA